ncbi:MAG: hypothetical protein WBA87_15655 [Microbacterium sp.]
MSVEEEVAAELDRLGIDGYRRAAAVRLAANIDDRGTASAVAELMKLMAEFGGHPSAAEVGGDRIAALRASVGIPDLRERRTLKRRASSPSEGKGRRHAPVR